MKFLLLLTCLLLSSTIVLAEETRYVSDEFSITMRTGQGTQHKIIKSVKTGTKLELLEESEDGYSKVRIPNGTEGWVLSRYLVNEPVAKDRLVSAEKKISALQSQTIELNKKLNSLSSSSSTLEKDSSRLSKSNIKLKKELDSIREIAANQIA
ncbi:MAG: TIGR04211 family SH3 domain-containing protein, partial [Gammaproteobacteria bacterium]|nr:TIGR04211 family SH3 domain-containing protein [Gammaproteobacteria bacterium]